MRILVVYKQSNLEIYSRSSRLERSPSAHAELKHGHDAHADTVAIVRAALAKEKTVWVRRDRVKHFDEARFDLIVTVGGDGTLLTVAPFLRRVPVLAVNSAPKVSVGYFAVANARNVASWVKRIAAGSVVPDKIQRLAVSCDDKSIGPPALNDVLFSHPQPGATTRLVIRGPKARGWEAQKNSGVWISTAAGSHGALGSAGGKRLPLRGKSLQYLVREPYMERDTYRQLGGSIAPGERLLLESRMPSALLSFDGWAEAFTVPFGAQIAFTHHEFPLLLFAPEA